VKNPGVDEGSPASIGIQPVFVVGVPRSGTTWIQRMLAMHPEAWALLETYMFSRRSGLGALLDSAPPPPDDGDVELPPPGLGRIFDRAELVDELRAIAGRWLARGSDGSRFVIEKSPWHLSDIDVIAEVLPGASFVHVVRDGRDVAVSVVAARRSWSRVEQRSPSATVREVAGLWADAMRQRDTAGALLGERLLEVRFEDVKSDPAGACARLFAHCGMPHDQELVARTVQATEFGRADRPHGEASPSRAGAVGQWRDRLGVRDAWAFERRAGKELAETGYEPDRGWWRRCHLRSRL
jgi:Sulfotransferase family